MKNWIKKLYMRIMGIPDYEKVLDDTLKTQEVLKEAKAAELSSPNVQIELKNEDFTEEEIKKLEELEAKALEDEDIVAAVYFVLNKNGDIDISTQWVEKPEYAKLISKLLWTIHSGGSKIDHLRFFDDYLGENPESLPYLKKVVAEWARLDKSDRPVVKPHTVLRIPHNGSAGEM